MFSGKLPQLKDELAVRGREALEGLKASLQRRLHGLLVKAAIERAAPRRRWRRTRWTVPERARPDASGVVRVRSRSAKRTCRMR